jgi:hypothetical protein
MPRLLATSAENRANKPDFSNWYTSAVSVPQSIAGRP